MALSPRDALPLKIETPRLVLRAPMRADVPALVELADNRKLADMLSRLPHPYTRADAIGFIEIVCNAADERAYAITIEGGRFIGCAGFHFHPDAPPELGYWLGEPYWGLGYGTEAVAGLLAAATETGLFPVIEARALAVNTASAHVLAKSGFVYLSTAPSRFAKFASAPIGRYRWQQLQGGAA